MTAGVVDVPRRKMTLEELRAHRDEIEEISRRYGVSNIRVFGSVARGFSGRLPEVMPTTTATSTC